MIEQLSRTITENKPPIPNQLVNNVQTGSVYKPIDAKTEQPLVPRYSAIPRTTSMEVAVSSEEGIEDRVTEDDSDIASLVDSLEDPTSRPNSSYNKIDNKPVRGDLTVPQLPEKPSPPPSPPPPPRRKSAAFFIKIKNDQILITKDDKENLPKLTNRMPKKILDKIHKRQLAIAKLKKLRNYTKTYLPLTIQQTTKSPAFKTLTHTNSNAITKKVGGKHQHRWLKELETMESFKIDSQGNMKIINKENNWTKRAQINQQPVVRKTVIKSSLKPKENASCSVQYSNENPMQNQTTMRKIYQKTQFNDDGGKHIEILEIVECCESNEEGKCFNSHQVDYQDSLRRMINHTSFILQFQ